LLGTLSEAAGLREGLWATQRGEYGSATRGGPSIVDVVIASDPITYPAADRPNVLVALTQPAADRYSGSVQRNGRIIVDPSEVKRPPEGTIAVPVAALAREHAGRPIAAGMVALGCVAALSDAVSLAALVGTIGEHVPRAATASNIKACAAGFDATRDALKGEIHA
jgi:2-oxoglutarate ferredoxin oxidoreductase subunit gamma